MISSPSLSISPLTPTLHHNASTSPSLMTSLWRNRKNSVSLWAQLTPVSPLFLPPLMSPSPMKIVRSLSSLLWFNQCCNFIKNTSPTPLLEESCVLEVCHPPLWEAVIHGHIFCKLCFPCFKIWNLNMLFWLSPSVVCPTNRTVNLYYGNYTWIEVTPNNEVTLPCKFGEAQPGGRVTRLCGPDGTWEVPRVLECNINAEVVIDIILNVSAKKFYFEFFPNFEGQAQYIIV